ADLLTANERLPMSRANRPPPVAGAVAHVVQQRRRRRRPALDQLRTVAAKGTHLALDRARDVHHERRLRVDAQVDAEVVEDPRRKMWLAGQVALRKLRPEAGVVD